jgi:hypothetical protein
MAQSVEITAPEEFRTAKELMLDRFAERGVPAGTGACVDFRREDSLAPGAYAVSGGSIAASDLSGALGGAGRYLRGCGWSGDGFEPFAGEISCVPRCSLRGVYFAYHFHNFYHVAPMPEIERYIEDLALEGVNAFMTGVPTIDLESADDPGKEESIRRITVMFKKCRSLGMKTCTGLQTNGAYKNFPREYLFTPLKDELGRHGNSGNMMCVASEGARKVVDGCNGDILRLFREHGAPIDYFMTWPYDEGGCGCAACSPWGGKGFLEMSKREFELAGSFYPEAGRIVSTWTFDTPYEGEWEALSRSLREDKWCDVILADAHEDYPRYPLDVEVPGGLPLITFPEISMWGLYPWGGFGATVLAERITKLWAEHRGKSDGGFCYSEGIFEDINKALIAALYADGDASPEETLAGYARYEFGAADTEAFVRLCGLLEKNHTLDALKGAMERKTAEEAYFTALKLDRDLPVWGRRCWRWRQILLRARLEFYRCAVKERGLDQKPAMQEYPEAMAAFRELVAIYHCSEHETNDPYHERVRPWAGSQMLRDAARVAKCEPFSG